MMASRANAVEFVEEITKFSVGLFKDLIRRLNHPVCIGVYNIYSG